MPYDSLPRGARPGLAFAGLLVIGSLACATLVGGRADPAATETAIAAEVMTGLAPTLEAALPSDTPEPEPTEPAPSSTPDPGAQVTATAEAMLDTIRSALPTYGLDDETGSLGWVHSPVTVEVKTFKESAMASDYPAVVARNFLAQTDVIWLTETGLAGCGIVFRADPQTETFYGMGLFRGGLGVAGFNEWSGGVSSEWERYRDAPSTNAANGATNTIAVLAREAEFSFYVNGVPVDTVSDASLGQGSVGFAAFSESGTTTCSFTNGWLWLLD
jgi:hypothetical protein